VATLTGKEGGVRLDLWLEEQPRPWRTVFDVFRDAGRKLAADHAADLVHDGIRIENIFVGADGHARLADLSPARVTPARPVGAIGEELRTAGASLQQRFASGDVASAAAYLAPEQFRGGVPDRSSNQFAFCVAFYRALYKQPPFDPGWAAAQSSPRRTPLGSVHFDLLLSSYDRITLLNLARQVLAGNVRPPSGETNDVPLWLDQIIRRGLAPDAVDRYPSMDELLQDMDRELAASAPRVGMRARPFIKWAFVVGGFGLAMLLAGLLARFTGKL